MLSDLNPTKKIDNGRTNKISLSTRYNSSHHSFFPIYRIKEISRRSDYFRWVVEIFEEELETDAVKKIVHPFFSSHGLFVQKICSSSSLKTVIENGHRKRYEHPAR